jgi:hypothetical protein
MSITVACSSLYMWIKQTEHFPWGLREVRALLVARGLAGFLAVFGMYCKSSNSLVWYHNVLKAISLSMLTQRSTISQDVLSCCLNLTVSSVI